MLAIRTVLPAQMRSIAKATLTLSWMMVGVRSACVHATVDGQELSVVFVHLAISLIRLALLVRLMAIVMVMRCLLPTMETEQAASALAMTGTVGLIVARAHQGTYHTLSVLLAAPPAIATVTRCL